MPNATMNDSSVKVVEQIHAKGKDTVSTEKTTTITVRSQLPSMDYIPEIIKTIGAYAWPFVLLVIVVLMKTQIRKILVAFEHKIMDSKSIDITKNGISIVSGETSVEAPASMDKNRIAKGLTVSQMPTDQQKILSTLWKHQMERDVTFARRWSFTLGDRHNEYQEFTLAANALVFKGLIAVNAKIGQFFLSDAGIEYCKTHSDSMVKFSYMESP